MREHTTSQSLPKLGASFETVGAAYASEEKEALKGVAAAFVAGAKFGSQRAANEFIAAQRAATPSTYVLPDIDGGRFEEWSLADFAGQCRMQSREQLDPEFSKFMGELAKRLAALATTEGSADGN